jgi:predicted NodU family carbamoyl transferase
VRILGISAFYQDSAAALIDNGGPFTDTVHGEHNRVDGMSGAYLGPSFSQGEIERRMTAAGATFAVLGEDEMIATTAEALAEQKAVGWFQGRMEFGPRSLGARSILGDPRSPGMQKNLNLKVKYRESFRPFAPAVLRENAPEWFDLTSDSPYMLIIADVKKAKRRAMSADEQALFGIDKLNVARSEIPAVTHVDYSARIQTVHSDTNPLFHKLLSRFKALTGCPILVNTSFNVRGEPIVCTPEDAFRCFMGSELDMLVICNCVFRKATRTPVSKVIMACHSILIEIIRKIRRRMFRLIKSFGSMCIAASFQDIFASILFPCGVGILDAFSLKERGSSSSSSMAEYATVIRLFSGRVTRAIAAGLPRRSKICARAASGSAKRT